MPSHRPARGTFTFTADDHIGQYLNHYPQSRHWFRTHEIPLANSTASLGSVLELSDPAQAMLSLAISVSAEPWADDPHELCAAMTLEELVDHICCVHHVYTRAELGRLRCIAEHLRHDASAADTTWFHHFVTFRRLLLDHLDEEEAVLFRACRELESSAGQRPISTEDCHRELMVMEHGHREVHHALELLQRELDDLAWPPSLQTIAVALLSGIKDLAQDLLVHSYKEEEYLLPATIHAEELYDSRHRARTSSDRLDSQDGFSDR